MKKITYSYIVQIFVRSRELLNNVGCLHFISGTYKMFTILQILFHLITINCIHILSFLINECSIETEIMKSQMKELEV